MALFGRKGRAEGDIGSAPNSESAATLPIPPRSAYCRICEADQTFSRCWKRPGMVHQCTCCETPFEDPRALYKRQQPSCPSCGEFLEQPGFEYGLCDGCGSKFELMEGTKPGLLPNRRQREEMDKYGKAWSPR